MIELSPKQAQYLEYIRQHLQDCHCLPTIADAADKFGVTANAAHDVYQYLVRKGALLRIRKGTKGCFKIAGVKVVLVDSPEDEQERVETDGP